MSSTFPSDGNLPTGSLDITIQEIPTELFTANNFNWSQGSTASLTRLHADGTPKASSEIPGFIEGSCDLQLADADATEPEINHTFIYGGYGYYLSGRGRTYESAGEQKFTANLRRCVNPLISYVAAQALTQSVAITTIELTVTGPESGLTYTYSAANLPAGVDINTTTGDITGTPTAVETTTATIYASATNAAGNTVKGLRQIAFTVTA